MIAPAEWRYWWSLPGPSSFVRALAEDLRRGANLVVGLPGCAPDGLGAALAAELRDDEFLRWSPLEWDTHGHDDILEVLCRRYAPDLAARPLYDPAELAASTAFPGTLVWITGIDQTVWAAWRALLDAYSDAMRKRRAEDRGLICLVAQSLPIEELPKEDAALSVHVWRDCVTELDMVAWLDHLMGQRPARTPMQRRLKLRHAFELVAYDAALAGEAVAQELDTLAAPHDWLQTVASVRGWTATTPPTWEEGTCGRLEGRHLIHPARDAISDDARTKVGSLLWRAQLGVLFPFLEEERHRYLLDYRSTLRVPHDTRGGWIISDRSDLEIGHIHHQLRHQLTPKEGERLRLLRDIRNALAHHQPLAPDLLQACAALA